MSDFDFNSPDWLLLRNAVANPVRQLIAVEIDSTACEKAVTEALLALDPRRPGKIVPLDSARRSAADLLAEVSRSTRESGDELNLVLVLDSPVKNSDEECERGFWRGMNQLREEWDAISAQIVFLLLPGTYGRLGLHADHLNRRIPLKLHLLDSELGEEGQSEPSPCQTDTDLPDRMSPEVARALLKRSEVESSEDIRRGVSPAELARRHYLPMFSAAVLLNGDANTKREPNRVLRIYDRGSGGGEFAHLGRTWELTPERRAEIEVTLRVLSCSAPGGCMLRVADGLREEAFTFYPDRIRANRSGLEAPVDLASDFITLRIKVAGSRFEVRSGSRVLLDGTKAFVAPATGGRRVIHFGGGSSSGQGEALWKTVRYQIIEERD